MSPESGPVSARAVLTVLVGFEQEPKPLFSFINIAFKQTGRGDVIRRVGHGMGIADGLDERLVVGDQLIEHGFRRDETIIVLGQRGELEHLGIGVDGGRAQLAHALGQSVKGGENGAGLLVQKQVIVAEMLAADMPVEILRLQIQIRNF